jgi:hypothetical protein
LTQGRFILGAGARALEVPVDRSAAQRDQKTGPGVGGLHDEQIGGQCGSGDDVECGDNRVVPQAPATRRAGEDGRGSGPQPGGALLNKVLRALRVVRGEKYRWATVACAPASRPARRDRTEKKSEPQDAAGEAAGLPASLGAGLAMSLAAGEAAAGLASAEASGAGVSSDLVQAVAAKSIEKRARIRNFRITTS